MQRILRCYDAGRRENRCSPLAAFGFAVDGTPGSSYNSARAKSNARVPCTRAFFVLEARCPTRHTTAQRKKIEDVVRRFETCSYTPEEFVHARHLTVAAWCFATMESDGAQW